MNAVAITYYQVFAVIAHLSPCVAVAVLCNMVRINGIMGRS